MGTSKTIAVRNGEVSISISLPRQAVSLIEIDWNGSIPLRDKEREKR